MYVLEYSYSVPPGSEAAYLDLQSRVARLYIEAGCRRYVVLKPKTPGGKWQEFTFFDDKDAFETVEAKLSAGGVLDGLFEEFLRLTRMKQSDLPKPSEFDLALNVEP